MLRQSDFRQDGQNRLPDAAYNEQRGGSLGEMGGVGFLLRNAETYELSESQQEDLRKMQIPFEFEKIDKLAALSKAKIVLRALARDFDAGEQDVMEAIDNVAACEADLRKMRYHHLRAARAQLDGKQRDRLVRMSRQRMRDRQDAAPDSLNSR
jgi:hypothetical protein